VIVDYHMHLRGPKGRDGSEPLVHTLAAVEAFVEVAGARGVDEIGFTEHVYYFVQTRSIWSLPYHVERCVYDLDAYVGTVLEARRTGLPVKLGLELDRVPGRQDELGELLAPYPWDFLLGSVHEVLEVAVDQEPGIWQRLSVEEIWRGYFDSLCDLARSRCVDVMAHPDLAKIYGDRPPGDVAEELYEQAARAFAESGVAVEISTAGLRKPVREIYPHERFLEACRRHGVPVTTASDAHTPDLVGYELGSAIELARRAGYETVSVFEGRSRRQEPLG
jgi:histidinol-phosphatase (PHP family)